MYLSVAPSGITLLSQELIDEIIDYFEVFWLPQHYSYAWVKRELVYLQSCSLISRVFRSRAQKHLFTRIGIDVHSESIMAPSLGRLNDVFSTNPRLASHVKSLTLRIRETADLWNGCFSHPNFFACMSHMLRSGDRYPRLSGLKIYLTSPRDSEPIELPAIGVSIPKASIVPWGMISHITSIQIHELHNIPIALFDSCYNLRTLDVFAVKLAPFEESKRIPLQMRPSIRELIVADSEDFICRTGLRFDTLERLVFQGTLYEEDLVTMQHIFTDSDSNLSSLEDLNFFLPDVLACDEIETSLYPKIGVDFAKLPNLRKLEFQAICFSPPGGTFAFDETDMITGLAQFLDTFPVEHKLKRIFILFDCSICNGEDEDTRQDVESHLKTGNWAALDAVFVRIASTAKQPLELSIFIEYHVSGGREMTCAEIDKVRMRDEGTLDNWGAKYLPRASKSGNVVMEASTQYGDGISDYDLRRKQELERRIRSELTFPGTLGVEE